MTGDVPIMARIEAELRHQRRSKPPTDKQLELLADLGIGPEEVLDREHASELIDEAIRERGW